MKIALTVGAIALSLRACSSAEPVGIETPLASTTLPTEIATTTIAEATTTTFAIPVVPAGIDFADPEGWYAIVIGSDWIPDHSRVEAGSEFWVVSNVVDGFAPNVNILSEPASGMTLDAYRASSIQGASQIVAQ